MLQANPIACLWQGDVKANNKVNHSRWRISSPPGARLCLAAPLCPVASGARGKVLQACGVLHRMASVTSGGTWDQWHWCQREWCPVNVYGGFVCFPLKADFSRIAMTEAGSSNSVVGALLCLVTKALLCWQAAQCPKLRMFSAYLLSFVFELIWHSCWRITPCIKGHFNQIDPWSSDFILPAVCMEKAIN